MRNRICLAVLAVVLMSSAAFAHNIASGCASNSDVTLVNGNSWQVMCSVVLSIADGNHYCVATGSAEIQNPHAGTQNDYLVVLSTSPNPGFDTAWERHVQLNDNVGIDDESVVDPSTVRFFSLGPATYTFYWLGKKKDSTDADAVVSDYSMGVVCTDGK